MTWRGSWFCFREMTSRVVSSASDLEEQLTAEWEQACNAALEEVLKCETTLSLVQFSRYAKLFIDEIVEESAKQPGVTIFRPCAAAVYRTDSSEAPTKFFNELKAGAATNWIAKYAAEHGIQIVQAGVRVYQRAEGAEKVVDDVIDAVEVFHVTFVKV